MDGASGVLFSVRKIGM